MHLNIVKELTYYKYNFPEKFEMKILENIVLNHYNINQLLLEMIKEH